MKLIKQTYFRTIIWLIPIFLVSSLLSFYVIKFIVYEETDEHLSYEMERIVKYHAKHNHLPEFHKIANIIEDYKLEKAVYRDTLIFEEFDNEMVPFRELLFTVNHNGQDFTLVLRDLLPGNDDVLEGSLLMMLALLFIISLSILLVINSISSKLWKPFYKTIDSLTKYRVSQEIPIFEKSNIEEFNTLNDTIEELLKKIIHDYSRTKNFNENASHELQTHLSIIKLNSEKLLNSSQLNQEQLKQIYNISNATSKLSAVQNSLLLLSKIGNLEFKNNVQIDISKTIENTLKLYEEIICIREIKLEFENKTFFVFMDKGLAEILINNLIKNAIKHNIQSGYISISLKEKILKIENSGASFNGNPDEFFERFKKGESGNIGLGLAIVKQICEVYNFKISYTILEQIHIIEIHF